MEPYSVNPTVATEVQEPYDVNPKNLVQVPQDIAQDRARRAIAGMPGLGETQSVADQISAGREQDLRHMAAAQVDMQNENIRQGYIAKLVNLKGTKLDPEELDFVSKLLTRKEGTDPNSVFEQQFSSQLLNTLKKAALNKPDSWVNDATVEIPNVLEQHLERGGEIRTHQEYWRTQIENAEMAVRNQTKIGWGVDFLKSAVPFYPYLKKTEVGKSIFAGQNIEQQSVENYSMPFKDMKAKNDPIMEKMINDNPSLAADYASNMYWQSNSDKFLNNFFPIISSVAYGVLGGVGKRLAPAALEAKTAAKTIVKAAEESNRFITPNELMSPENQTGGIDFLNSIRKAPTSPGAIEEAVGDIQAAGVKQAAHEIANGAGDPLSSMNALQSSFSISASNVAMNVGNARQEVVNKITTSTLKIRDQLTNLMESVPRVDRTPAIENALTEVVKNLNHEFPGIENNIMNTTVKRDPITGLLYPEHILGKNSTEFFGSFNSARKFVTANGLEKSTQIIDSEGKVVTRAPKGTERVVANYGKQPAGKVDITALSELQAAHPHLRAITAEDFGASIEQKGISYQVRMVSGALKETDSVIRDSSITTHTKTPTDNWFNGWFGKLGSIRTAEETLSKAQRENRKVGTFGPNKFYKIIDEHVKELKQLKGWAFTPQRKKWKEWQKVVAESDKMQDPITGRRGEMIEHPSDLDHLYQNILHRSPDDQEYYAFFQHKNIQRMTDALNNNTAYGNKSRLGAKTWTLADPYGETTGKIDYHNYKVDGVKQTVTPKGREVVLVVSDKPGQHGLRSGFTKAMKRDVETGVRTLIKLTDPNDFPMANFSGLGRSSRIEYVLSHPMTGAKFEPLNWQQIRQRKPSYDYEHFIVQAIMHSDPVSKITSYLGDRTIAAHGIRAAAGEIASTLDKIRVHLKDNNITAAKKVLTDSHWPQEWSEVKGMFEGPDALSLEHNIQVTPRGKTVGDMPNDFKDKGIRDTTAEGYGRYFEGQRDHSDVFTMDNVGTKDNPIYNRSPAKEIDPTTTMNRAITRAVNNVYLNDYKIFSVEHWIQEAKDLLDVKSKSLADYPYWHFFNPQWHPGADAQVVNNLMTANFQIKQFLAIQDKESSFLHSATQALADSIYPHSPKMALTPAWLLPKLRDPAGFIRSVVFEPIFGLFSVAQLPVQLNTWTTITGVAGAKFAAPGAKASMLHVWAHFTEDPATLAKIDKIASTRLIPGTAEFKPGQFLEARDLLQRSGMSIVGGEHAALDFLKAPLTGGAGKTFLNWGQVFFRAANKNTRIGAFYTSYLEYRAANPTGRITRAGEKVILDRADTLEGNMTRASASAMNQGFTSFPMMFLTYQTRLTELALGKRLSTPERIRLYGTYSAMYGLPVGAAVAGFPSEYINKWAIENDWVDPTKNDGVGQWIKAMTLHGIPEATLALATGKWYNVSQRYGVQGYTHPFTDILKQDKTFLDVIGGAPYSFLANTLKSSSGFYRSMLSLVTHDKDTMFPLRPEDAVDIFKTSSGFSDAWRLQYALRYGKWLSNREGWITDTTKANAIFMYLSGLRPQAANDMISKTWTISQDKDMEKKVQSDFNREVHRALQSAKDGDPEQYKEYMTRAKALLYFSGFPRQKYGQALQIAVSNNMSLIQQVDWDFYMDKKDIPTYREKTSVDTYRRTLQRDK